MHNESVDQPSWYYRQYSWCLELFWSCDVLQYFWLALINKVKLATVVKDDQKAPFSIATTLRCRGGHYSFPLICTLYCWVLSKEVSSTTFKVFGMTWPGIEPRSPGSLANTLPTRPMNPHNKCQKIIESVVISLYQIIKLWFIFYNILSFLAKLILKENNISFNLTLSWMARITKTYPQHSLDINAPVVWKTWITSQTHATCVTLCESKQVQKRLCIAILAFFLFSFWATETYKKAATRKSGKSWFFPTCKSGKSWFSPHASPVSHDFPHTQVR